MPEITIYTDGSARSNPGRGGYGAVLKYTNPAGKTFTSELSRGYAKTTNNRMELTAVIEGLRALKKRCHIKIYTDSQYVANAITKGWAVSWRRNGWRKADKKPALNAELWEELLKLLETQEYEIIWVKGHAGHPENERCDQLAVAQSQKFR